MTTQKERWAVRAGQRQEQAAKMREQAERLLANRCTDHAFMTQPGHIPARARELARMDKAMNLLAAAERAEEKASNLRAMSKRNAGDAESDKQAAREASDWQVGQVVFSILYGRAEVLKVNAKTLRLKTERTGGTITEDKCRIRAA